MPKRIYNLSQIAERNKVSRQHVRDLMLRGELPENDFVDDEDRPYWGVLPDATMMRPPGKKRKATEHDEEK